MADKDILGLTLDTLPVPGDVLEGQKAAGGAGSSKRWPIENVKGYQIYKPVDESLVSDTTLQDDDHLKFPMLANEIWQFEFFLFVYIDTSTPDIKLALNGPAGLSNLNSWFGAVATDINNFKYGDIITAYEATHHPAWGNAPDPVFAIIKGTVKNGATPGDLVLRWAQFISNATPTTIQQGSYLLANKLG